VTRRTSSALRQSFELELGLVIGPTEGDGLSDEDYELGWHYHGARILEEYVGPFATRPWGWWAFEAGEPMPAGRDAERSGWSNWVNRDDELAALRERTNEARLRIGTSRERVSGGALGLTPEAFSVDARAVELLERVEGKLRD
jgi:hypothetical protein